MPRTIPTIEDCKRAADLLLKDVHSNDLNVASASVERFRRIAPFKDQEPADILQHREEIQLKHALAVIAREHGYIAWKNLKDAADVLWCPPNRSAYWHNWCKTHAEARAYLEEKGGYLLSAHGKCFIAEAGYIESLGLDPNDPRWERIGFDVVEPRDKRACEELVEMRRRESLGSR